MVGETAKRKRGAPFLALLLMMLMIFLHNTPCGATSSTSIFNAKATSPYLARMDELEWMFDSEISRMLGVDKGHLTPKTGDAIHPVIICDRGPDYRPCLPGKNPQAEQKRCPYNRSGVC
jgi:hypothetical protein